MNTTSPWFAKLCYFLSPPMLVCRGLNHIKVFWAQDLLSFAVEEKGKQIN